MTDATLLNDRSRPAIRLERRLADPPPIAWQALTERRAASFRPLAGAQVLNKGSPGSNASSADAPGRRSSSEPSVVQQHQRR